MIGEITIDISSEIRATLERWRKRYTSVTPYHKWRSQAVFNMACGLGLCCKLGIWWLFDESLNREPAWQNTQPDYISKTYISTPDGVRIGSWYKEGPSWE